MLCIFYSCFFYIFVVYRHPADDDVRGDTSGSFQTLCLVQLCKSGDDSGRTDERTIEEDARRLSRVNRKFRHIPMLSLQT